MVLLRKRRLIAEDSDSEQGDPHPPTSSSRTIPQFRDDSDAEVNNARFESPCKRMRRVVLDDEDEEDEEEDMVNCPTNTQAPPKPVPTSHMDPAAASMLRIPPELIRTVLEQADPAEILDLRLLSSGFKKDIDTHVMYHTIQRVELIGYLGPKEDPLLEHLAAEDYWGFAFVRATFDRLDDQPSGKPVWEPDGAHCRIEKSWFDAFERVGGAFVPGNAWWDHVRQCLDLEKTTKVYGQLRWCVKVGPAVLDFGIEDEDEVDIQLVEREDDDDDDDDDEPGNGLSVRVTNWKLMLLNFFREERALKLLLEETKDDEYTYNHVEDSLRSMRRKRFRSKLDPNDRNDSRNIWKIDNMIPLWNKHTFFSVERDYCDVETTERNAVHTLMLLRKEASMSTRERAALDTILVERAQMHSELQKVDQLFKKWQENVLALPNLSLARLDLCEELDPNPMTWSKEIVERELGCLARWKGQRPAIAQLVSFLDAIDAVAALDEAAFDGDSEDDF